MIRAGRISLGFLALMTALSVFAPWVTPTSYEVQNLEARLEPPSASHWMGTDALGRDLYSRVIYGGRLSLALGVGTALFALLLGTAYGAISGWLGGRWDRVMMQVVDLVYIFPTMLLAILLMILLGRGFLGLFLSLSLATWTTQARLVRALVLQAKELSYVESARAFGVRGSRILFRHILPNLRGPIVVSLTLQIPNNILAESFLSFIGLGFQPPYSSWGSLANEGFRAMKSVPHLMIFPSLVLFFTMLAFNYLGESLRPADSSRSAD